MTILSGMNEMDQLLDNIKTFNDETPVSKEELEAVNQVRDELMTKQKVPCTGCRYCMPCPFGVDIPVSYTHLVYSKDYLSQIWIPIIEEE